MSPCRSVLLLLALAGALLATRADSVPGPACPGAPQAIITVEIFAYGSTGGRQSFLIEGQRVTEFGASTDGRVYCGGLTFGGGSPVAEERGAPLPTIAALLDTFRANDALVLSACSASSVVYPTRRVTLTVFKVPGDITATNTISWTRSSLGACDPRIAVIDGAIETFLNGLGFSYPCTY